MLLVLHKWCHFIPSTEKKNIFSVWSPLIKKWIWGISVWYITFNSFYRNVFGVCVSFEYCVISSIWVCKVKQRRSHWKWLWCFLSLIPSTDQTQISRWWKQEILDTLQNAPNILNGCYAVIDCTQNPMYITK